MKLPGLNMKLMLCILQSDRQGLVREEEGERGQQDRHKSTCRLFSFFFSFYKIVFCFATVEGKGVDYYFLFLYYLISL